MSYAQILCWWIVVPLLLLMMSVFWWAPRAKYMVIHLALLAVIAVGYTTPWDNYLVATGVWWYDPNLVLGIHLGYVPLEEYAFFVLQTFFTSLVLVHIKHFIFPSTLINQSTPTSLLAPAWSLPKWLVFTLITMLGGWVLSGWLWLGPYPAATYLALILVWALPPLMLALGWGARYLLAHWQAASLTLVSTTLYLWLLDTLALGYGTWKIDPYQTTGWQVWWGLPVEEALFFFLTNALVIVGYINISSFLEPTAAAPTQRKSNT